MFLVKHGKVATQPKEVLSVTYNFKIIQNVYIFKKDFESALYDFLFV